MSFVRFPLIATDGFEFYEKVVRRVFGPACLYGQVIETRGNATGRARRPPPLGVARVQRPAGASRPIAEAVREPRIGQ